MQDKFYEMAKNAILCEIKTRDTQKILDKIQNNKANEKALEDFRKLSNLDKFQECINYGSIMSIEVAKTVDGFLKIRKMSIYGKCFLFISLNDNILNCYELQ